MCLRSEEGGRIIVGKGVDAERIATGERTYKRRLKWKGTIGNRCVDEIEEKIKSEKEVEEEGKGKKK